MGKAYEIAWGIIAFGQNFFLFPIPFRLWRRKLFGCSATIQFSFKFNGFITKFPTFNGIGSNNDP